MNSSYLLGEDDDWGRRYFFTYYSQFGNRKGASGIEVVTLAVTFILAVGANCGIAICVLKYKEIRTPMNLCLVNLAAADLLFTLGVPAVAFTRLTQSWSLGEITCKLLPYSQFVCGFVLLWTLTLISMDRHRCLVIAPYRSALTNSRVIGASLITWIIGSLIFLPVAFWFRIQESISEQKFCTLVFPRNDTVNISLCFTIPIIIVGCLLPMCLLVYHYQKIFQRILDTRSRWAVSCVTQTQDGRTRRDSELSVVGTIIPWAGRKSSSASVAGGRQGRTGSLSQHEEIRLHKHLRVVRILLLNVIAVLIMWLPITIIMLLIYLDGRRSTEDTNFFLKSHHFIWTLIIAHLNTVVNPLLYGIFSENFRAYFTKLWQPNRNNDAVRSDERASGDVGFSGVYAVARMSPTFLEPLQKRPITSRGASSNSIKSSSSRSSYKKKIAACSNIESIIEVPSPTKL